MKQDPLFNELIGRKMNQILRGPSKSKGMPHTPGVSTHKLGIKFHELGPKFPKMRG